MKVLSTLALSASFLAVASCAQADPQTVSDTQSDRAVLEAMSEQSLIDFLVDNPTLLRDAIIAYEDKQTAELLASLHDDLYNNPADTSVGPADAKVTIVEFFDYNCGYCKRSTEWLKQVMETYPDDVRIVFKELPLLDARTKTSRNAAKAALAAARQGKYLDMHFALMEARGLTAERIDTIAEEHGVNVSKMRAEMQTTELNQHLEDTTRLARQIPQLNGTPFFIIGDQFMAGANEERLQQLLDDALDG